MKRALLLFALVVAPVLAEPEAQPTDALKFLAGTWKGTMGGGEFIAYYTTPEGGKVLSLSRMLRGGRAVFYEFEVFESDADGKLVFTPYPGGKMKETFQLGSVEKNKVVFDNPKKDFPTRITYHRVADDNLVITLSDPHNGAPTVQKFDLKRVK